MANVVTWPLLHLMISWFFTKLPGTRFDPNSWLYREKRCERGGSIYESFFRVKVWKGKLPDAAAWFAGGFPKRKILSRDVTYLNAFVRETCRGEGAHWVTVACCPLFFLWNPLWADVVMVVYALAANVPCIVVQRYNRLVLRRLIIGRRARASA